MERGLLATKVRTPPVRGELVSRSRLLERLDEALQHKLTLIAAPAGFGKTTLAAAWVADRTQEPGVAAGWLSVDEGDDDLVRFLSYLAAALEKMLPAVAAEIQALLHSPHPPPPAEAMTILVNGLVEAESAERHFLLIIDDFHLLTAAKIHEALAFLLEHQPPCFHLILITRADPPLPLPRLRARGQLLEIRQSDLRFSHEEAARFLEEGMGLPLEEAEIATLTGRTEGWIAGLQMAALALRGRPEAETASFVAQFTGTHRYVLDYLLEEVLQRQPEEVQQFLLRTSILGRLTAPLCDFLLSDAVDPQAPILNPRSQQILSYLDAQNLFLVPLDEHRCWYRTHRLFADLLRLRLEQTLSEQMPRLHRRAAAWHEADGEATAAIDHLLAAGDRERAATLVAANAESVVMRGEIMTLLRWVEALPEDALAARPHLALLTAWALLLGGQAEGEIERQLQRVEADPVTAGWTGAIRGYVELFQGEIGAARRLAGQALSALPDEALFLRQLALLVQSVASRYEKGRDPDQGLAATSRAGAAADNILVAVFGLCMRADLAQRAGDLKRAQAIYEQALDLAKEGEGLLPVASEPLFGLATLALERFDLAQAERLLADGMAMAQRWSGMAALDGYLLQARLHFLQGEHVAMWSVLDEAAAVAHRFDAVDVDDLIVDLFRCQKEIAVGRLAEARYRVQSLELRPEAATAELAREAPPTRKYEYHLLARLYLAEGRPEEALQLLDLLLPYFERRRSRIATHLLRAMAYEALGAEDDALGALATALHLGEEAGMAAVVVEEGEPVARLLYRALEAGIAPSYTSRLLGLFAETQVVEGAPAGRQAARAAAQGALIEPLSERELEVLALVAEGLTNQEIADRLFLSLATVKWHTSNIYGKLAVGNRTEAVTRAQALGLLPLSP